MIPLVLLAAFLATPAEMTVTGVSVVETVSHDRVRVGISTSSPFPFSGQVGWRLYFSRYYIPYEDPQYEYAVYSMPGVGSDLSRDIWFVRPQGLIGQWYLMVNAIDADRKTLATTGSVLWTFAPQDVVVENGYLIQWVVCDNYWSTGIVLTNLTASVATVTLELRTVEGTLFHTMLVSVPASGSYVRYLNDVVSKPFSGSVHVSSDVPIKWLTFTTDSTKYITLSGGSE